MDSQSYGLSQMLKNQLFSTIQENQLLNLFNSNNEVDKVHLKMCTQNIPH